MPRIASFLASGTEIVAALGLKDDLVAISHECDWPPDVLDRPRLSRPRFDPAALDSGGIDRAVRDAMLEYGSVYAIDDEALALARPDVILTQAVCEVCAVPTPGVADAVARLGLAAEVVSLDAHTVQDILDSILRVGTATGAADQAADVVADLSARIERVRDAVRDAARPGVLALEWLDPPFAPGHWVPEMVEIAGGLCLAGTAGAHSLELAWSDLAGLDPDILILMPCGYGLEATRRDADAVAGHLREVAPRAIADGRAWIVDGSSYFNRSGPRFVTGLEILAGVIHADRFAAPPAGTAARWGGAWSGGHAPESR
ncbi:MAG TPA: ABC transporter substrate-binding protein [Longimicrobiales bacterium]|nr:ABC transporter substrate-binding protein [Longimicrobiales bacterium]